MKTTIKIEKLENVTIELGENEIDYTGLLGSIVASATQLGSKYIEGKFIANAAKNQPKAKPVQKQKGKPGPKPKARK